MKGFKITEWYILALLIMLPYSVLGTMRTSGADFLKLEISPAASGMAGAFVGMKNNIESMDYNLANIAELKNIELKTIYSLSLFEVNIGKILFASPLRYGVWGINTEFVRYPELTRYGMWGENIETISGIYEVFFSLGYGINILKTDSYSWNWGVGAQYTRRSIWKYKRDFFSFNLGWNFFTELPEIFKIKNNGVSLGFAIMNIQPFLVKEPIEANKTYLPLLYSLGISIILGESFLLNTDYRYFQNINDLLKTGIEYRWSLNHIKLKFRTGAEIGSDRIKYCGGLGFEYSLRKFVLNLDYGVNYRKEPGTVHNIGLGIRFSKRGIHINIDELYYKGVHYFINEDYDKAEECFQEVLSIDSGYQKAEDRLKEIKQIKKLMEIREKYESENPEIEEYFKKNQK